MSDHGDYTSSVIDPYIDQTTGILRNLPRLSTPSQLDDFEAVIFQAHALEAASYARSCRVYSLENWQFIHGICFADVYDWAGDIRSIRIHKGNTTFAYPENIESEALQLFKQLNMLLASDTNIDDFAVSFAEMNILHPFREGNGRTQRILYAAALEKAGWQIDYRLMPPDVFIAALALSFYGKYMDIISLFRTACIRR